MRIDELKRLCGQDGHDGHDGQGGHDGHEDHDGKGGHDGKGDRDGPGRPLIVGCGLTGASVARHLARAGVAFDAADAAPGGARAALLAALGDVDATLERALERARFHDALEASEAYDVLLLSPGIPRAHAAVRAALARGATVVGDIELFAGAAPAARTVAVTGSNGKSTVVAWLAHALRGAGIDARECGNIGVPALDALVPTPEGSAPVPGRRIDSTVYVLELSSYQLESTRSLAPLVACVLNVSEDHLDRYDSIEHYGAVKRHVYAHAVAAICNDDDARTRPDGRAADATFAAAPPTRGAARAGAAGPVRWHLGDAANDAANGSDAGTTGATDRPRDEASGQGWLCRDGASLVARSGLRPPGRHNALNALAVLALGEATLDALGDADAGTRARLMHALQGWGGLAHRTELVHEACGVRWYDDSKGTNVDACAKAIEAMPGPVVLIMGGLSKGADFAPLAPLVRERVRTVVLIGRDRAEIARALEGAAPLHEAETLEAAVGVARDAARAGDAVLLSPACASFDMFRNFEERGRRFAAAARAEVAA